MHFAVMDICQLLGLGATVVLSGTVEPRGLDQEMDRTRTTVLCTVPSVARLLVRAHHAVPDGLELKAIRTSAAELAAQTAHALAARYRTSVVQQWASTESYTALTTPAGGCPEGSIGKPVDGVRVQIVDGERMPVASGQVGQLLIRTPGMMLGYLGDPVETARALSDGWLNLGDLAWQDEDGFIYLAGRHSHRINVGGWKVSPEEVEAVLMEHPGVKLAAVTRLPSTLHGEIVRAIVVTEAEPPSVAELRRFCRARLAAYKVPRIIEFQDAIPVSPLGKILRNNL
jgi:long-chain acyl-CoA synthetase